MEMNFCRRCGAALNRSEGHIFVCKNGHTIFANASPSVGVWLVNEKDEVLVTKRQIDPGKGLFNCIGGFIDGATENFEQAAIREVSEEVGVTKDQYEPLKYVSSGDDLYNYSVETIPNLSVFFWARIDSHTIFTPQDDVESVEFIPVHSVDLSTLYFDSVKDSLVTLRNSL